MRASSVRASSIRSRSFESMTKMRPWVPVRTSRQRGVFTEQARLAQDKQRRAAGGRPCAIRCTRTCRTRNRVAAQHTREVVSPQRANLVLAADVPDVELCVLVCDGLDVEADGGDGGHVLVELELVEDCCRRRSARGCSRSGQWTHTGLAGGVEPQHEQAHFLGSEDLVHHLRYLATHCECVDRGLVGERVLRGAQLGVGGAGCGGQGVRGWLAQ